MILDAIMTAFAAVIRTLLDVLPTASVQDYSGITSVVTTGLGLNKYLPVAEMLAAVGVVLTFNLARMAFFVAGWVYQRIPGKLT